MHFDPDGNHQPFEVAARLVVIAVMPVLSQVLVASMVVFVVIIAIMSAGAIVSAIAAMTIMPVATIIRASAMAVVVTCFVSSVTVARAIGLGIRLIQSLLLLFLLELVDDATCVITILALLEEADELDVIVRKCSICLRIFL